MSNHIKPRISRLVLVFLVLLESMGYKFNILYCVFRNLRKYAIRNTEYAINPLGSERTSPIISVCGAIIFVCGATIFGAGFAYLLGISLTDSYNPYTSFGYGLFAAPFGAIIFAFLGFYIIKK